MTIGRYEYSVTLLLIGVILCPLVFAATYYIWTSRTASLTVEEPLSIVEFPTSIHFHPGENATINIVIVNQATISYEIRLFITLTDTEYQQSYTQVSDNMYTIRPGNNTISAWIAVSKGAPPSEQQVTIDFLRL